MLCPNCNQPIDSDAYLCSHCGTNIIFNKENQNLGTVLDNLPVITLLVDDDVRVKYINHLGQSIINKNYKSILNSLAGRVFNCVNALKGQGCGKNIECKDCPVRTRINHTLETGESIYMEEGQLTLSTDNSTITFDFLISTTLMKTQDTNQVLVTILDISNRKRMENELQQQLQEKKLLLKAVNHRIKNNLKTLSNFISVQASAIKDNEVKSNFKKANLRLRAMSNIYNMIYDSDNLKQINIKDYLSKIIDQIEYSYILEKIFIHKEIEEIILTNQIAFPIVLIVTELITNSLKYSFKDNPNGLIKILLKQTGPNILLEISDNGIAIPSDIIENKTFGFGLNMVQIMVEQVNGNINFNSNTKTGNIITIEIPYKNIH